MSTYSNYSKLTPSEIIELKEQYPTENILGVDIENTRTNRKGTTYYVPIFCKRTDGTKSRLHLKITKQVLPSSAKLGFGVKPKKANKVVIAFRELSNHDFEKTDYAAEHHGTLHENNRMLIKAFDIIVDEYLSLIEQDIKTYDGYKFDVTSSTVFSIRQSTRKVNNEDIEKEKKMLNDSSHTYVKKIINKRIKLKNSLYRVKIPANMDNKQRLGKQTQKGHQYNVFDARKQKANNGKPVPAMVKSKGKRVYLTTGNASYFVTYMSLVAGVIDFDSICISPFGISLMATVRDLHVWPHKTIKTVEFKEDELNELSAMASTGYNDDEDIEELLEDNKDDCDDSDDLESAESSGDTDDNNGFMDDDELDEPVKKTKKPRRKHRRRKHDNIK